MEISYTPKYTSITDVKAKLKPRADRLSDDDILLGIEQGERETDDFFESCNRDVDNLTEEETKAAKWIALVKSCRFLVSALPIKVEEKRLLFEQLKEEDGNLTLGIMRRVFKIPAHLKGVFKRIPVEEEDFYG